MDDSNSGRTGARRAAPRTSSTTTAGIANDPATGRRESTSAAAATPAAHNVTSGEQAGWMAQVRERASSQLNSQKDRATEGIGSAAQAVRQSTHQLRDQRHESVARYVESAADQLERLSQRLKQKDVGELLEDAQRLARRQPALFIGGAFALGLLGSRFLKSSPQRREPGHSGAIEPYGTPYGRPEYGTRAIGTSGSSVSLSSPTRETRTPGAGNTGEPETF